MKYLTLLLFITLLSCKSQDNELRQKVLINERSNEIFNNLVQIRRDIHMYPEMAGQEKRTSKIIEQYLLNLGLEVKTNIGGYGVVGILKGNNKGKKIAWRADIDALENNFPDKVEFISKIEGVRHICGHDIHTVIGLGIANILAKHKKNIDGTVYFIFQPSEENFKGAKAMIDDGLFDTIKPDEIYALHIGPMQKGIILTKPGEIYSYTRTIRVEFQNTFDIDSLKELANSIAKKLARVKLNSEPWDMQKLLDPKIGLENPETIYQDYLIILGSNFENENNNHVSWDITFNETNKTNLDSIPFKIKDLISDSKYKDKLLSIEYTSENPTVVNDSTLTNVALQTISKRYGDKSIMFDYGQVPFFNDDFAYFQQHIPGVYFLLGGSNFEKKMISLPHSPDFVVDEETIRFAIEYFSSLILARTNDK